MTKNAEHMTVVQGERGHALATTIEPSTAAVERKLVTKSPAELQPWDRNARMHSIEQVQTLCLSLRQFGFVKPIVVDESLRVLAGHGIREAAIAMKLAKVPVLVVSGLSDEQKRAYVIADNRTAEQSTWDKDLLGLELSELQTLGFDLADVGFSTWAPGDDSTDSEFETPDVETQHECPKCGYKF